MIRQMPPYPPPPKLSYMSSVSVIRKLYLCYEYTIAHVDRFNVDFVVKKICINYTNHEFSRCNTVNKICKMLDRLKHSTFVNK